MQVIRRPTFPALQHFEDEMNTLWRQFFSPVRGVEAFYPALNVEETDDEIIVSAELPGLDPKEVTVSVEGRDLLLAGEKKLSRQEKKATCHLEEIVCGKFLRRLTLPAEVVADKTSADYKAGTLRITLPKTATERRTRVPIHAGKE